MESQDKAEFEKREQERIRFEYELSQRPKDVQGRYIDILAGEQLRLAKEKGRPIFIPYEKRNYYLDVATRYKNSGEIEKVINMDRHWDNATTYDRKGNPRTPQAGAPDDLK